MIESQGKRTRRLRTLSSLAYGLCGAFVIVEFVLVALDVNVIPTIGGGIVVLALVVTAGILRGRANPAYFADLSGDDSSDDHGGAGRASDD